MAQAFIGLGSNLGDGRRNLLAAWARLGQIPGVSLEALSNPYETAPMGMESGHWFINAVGRISTQLQAHKLLGGLLRIEVELGRDRTRTKDRPVDLDLLYYDDLVLDSADLVLPHPEIHNRLFVLVPLEELAPDLSHPLLGRTTAELRKKLAAPDQTIIKTAWHNNGDRLAST